MNRALPPAKSSAANEDRRPRRERSQRNGTPKPAASKPATSPKSRPFGPFLTVLLILSCVLVLFFFRSFLPDYILFSNDGPLGRLMSQCQRFPQKFFGAWQDLNGLGYSLGGAWPSITSALVWLLGPVGFSKFYAPLGLLTLGLGAWYCFRQIGLAPVACILGALAATLNSGFFSAACWGIAAHPLSLGMSFFALGVLVTPAPRNQWLKAAVAGFAVGIGVAEGADLGAILSLFVAVFAIYRALIGDGSFTARLIRGVAQVLIMAVVAGLVAAQAIRVLSSTQLHGVPTTQLGSQNPEARWDWATQWSLPKREALTVIIPGLFGYRMDSPDGGNYWGAVGRDAAWDRYFASGGQGQKPLGYLRFSGGGEYAGLLVVLVTVWALFQSFRREGSVFSATSKKFIFFWFTVLVGSLLLAFGRHAPFYRIFYQLPYSSAMRNPAKFMHVLSWALVILFAYGVHGLSSLYFVKPISTRLPGTKRFADRAKANGFERRWFIGCGVAIGASLLAAIIYIASEPQLVSYLQGVGFDEALARNIASFSFHEVGWYVAFLLATVGLLFVVSTGWFAGRRSAWGGAALGLLLVLDLGRANQPWVGYLNYLLKCNSNSVLDVLRDKPYEHRVTSLPPWLPGQFGLDQTVLRAEAEWDAAYQAEWLQQLFPFYDVQTLDLVQTRTIPPDLASFEHALQYQGTSATFPLIARRWQLTNTRYVLGGAELLPSLNKELDPVHHRFTMVSRFDFTPKPGILSPKKFDELDCVPSAKGRFALFEFGGALPRASLYSNWQVLTNNEAALRVVTNADFDPSRTVLVSNPLPAAQDIPKQNPGTVTFLSYAPKQIRLQVTTQDEAVLLLNDRFDPDWTVSVDGKSATLLRCNFLMRGVVVAPGSHQIQFQFKPRLGPLYLSFAAVMLGLVLTGVLLFGRPQSKSQQAFSTVSGEFSKSA